VIGCTSLATLTAARFYLLLIPLVLPVLHTGYPVPGTTYLGFMWTRMLDIGQCMTIKQEGEYERQEKGVNCVDLGSHQETKKSIGRVYTK